MPLMRYLQAILIPLVWLVPIFAGILIELGPDKRFFYIAAQIWAFFALIFLFWNGLRILLAKNFSAKSWLCTIGIVLCSAALVLTIHVLRERTSDQFFYVLMASLLLGAGAETLHKKNMPVAGAAFFYTHNLGVGFLSLSAVLGVWIWQPLAVAAALAFLPLTVRSFPILANYHEQQTLSRSALFCLVVLSCSMAPLIFSILGVFGVLPKPYALMAALLLLIKEYLPVRSDWNSVSDVRIDKFRQDGASMCALTVLVLCILRLL